MGAGSNPVELVQVRWTPVIYKNVSEETLRSRNPRLDMKPGDTVELNPDWINHSIRGWLRTGQLVEVEEMAKKPAAKKTAAKPRARAKAA
jgi:hypothetical protein